eukprot:TRINITY_DN7228_c0_g1_i2.p1 TRINITY_DN7228_c0_g1~~TRINITY_DN7228_c0_g1_i2.p1  ORF type:complete len:1100 (+),score=114.71 TRINITY_DN7228_c0_g1_i2:76-3375(+)
MSKPKVVGGGGGGGGGSRYRGCDVLGLPDKQNPRLMGLTAPHLESFDFALADGLTRAVNDLDRVPFKIKDGPNIELWFEEMKVNKPSRDNINFEPYYPAECRESGQTYGAPFFATIRYSIDGKGGSIQRCMGRLPIMVKSKHCNLFGLNPTEMVRRREEASEMGGYFIINGLEKVMRMLIAPRRNHVTGAVRGAYANKGKNYSQFATIIRSVRPDESASYVTLHYLTTGNCNVRFTINKQEFFVPVAILLKALVNTTDREIYENLVRNDNEDTFIIDRVDVILREGALTYDQLRSRDECLAFLGRAFRTILRMAEKTTDLEAGEAFLRKYLFVHLEPENYQGKFNLLINMVRKLYALAEGKIGEDDADSPGNQELLLGGHLYLAFLKEKLYEWLLNVRILLMKFLKSNKGGLDNDALMRKCFDSNFDIGQKVQYLLSTGNLVSSSGLAMMQTSGLTLVADKLNFLRFMAHFRCVHRGAFFAQMKTTSVRKLTPESWGFFCPVHTPDGAVCGLVNHLTSVCKVINTRAKTGGLPRLLASLGMSPVSPGLVPPREYIDIFLDGEIIGYILPALAPPLVAKLRYLKVKGLEGVPDSLEIGLIMPGATRLYPGLFLFASMARMMRPVKLLSTGETEYIGTFEQVFMDIAVREEDVALGSRSDKERFTHVEINPINIFSVVGSIIPYSDMNQSPRNMYQCQMCKQTMGTPMQAWEHRADNKLYRLQTGQRPAVRTEGQSNFDLDDYPNGTNAVVAVLSYTGYDMEDAMIINKAAWDRGFEHASVYKTEIIDVGSAGSGRSKKTSNSYLNNPVIEDPDAKPKDDTSQITLYCPQLDPDGLPFQGQRLETDMPYYCVTDNDTGKTLIKRFKSKETAYVDQVRIIGTGPKGIQKASIKLRFNRNPVIGDKFASRHGQKGVLAQLWPQEDMPFSESGMTPDCIINPHAFPSRMTIGMLVESMAGKSASLHGVFQDATSFKFNEKHRAVDYFGEQLLKAGYNYYGNEPMYSGVLGTELRADIFFGVVHYQRLRHMVGDKYQVRSTGPVDRLTQQPIKVRVSVCGMWCVVFVLELNAWGRVENVAAVSVLAKWNVTVCSGMVQRSCCTTG